jgi:hypothetical protein
MEARSLGTARLRVQMLDDANNGVIGDFNLISDGATLTRLGTAQRINWDSVPTADGWRRLSLTTTLRVGGARVLLQVMDRNGAGSFAPDGEAVALRSLFLEFGQSPRK